MGRQIPRLSRGAGVAPAGAPQSGSRQAESFGVWFARERRLRDISVEFVAARTKLPLERIRALEGDTAPLGPDGRSRAVARTLARAIGADPEEASARLPGPVAPPSPGARSGRIGAFSFRLPDLWRPARWLPGGRLPVGLLASVLAALGLGLAAWGVAAWLERPPSAAETPEVIYRPDYLKHLDEPGR